MKRPVKAVILGMGTGILGIIVSLLPFVLELEEKAGLDWLFTARGTRTPPDDVVIVSIDRHSADRLGLPEDPEIWPRSVHAELVDRLVDAGAAVIVFDIFFREARAPRGDAALASAFDAAGNVVLFEYIKKDITRMPAGNGQAAGDVLTQSLVPPVAHIADAARALAPFPLPVFPIKVSQFWAFNPGTADLPTIPVVALQLYTSGTYTGLLQWLDEQFAEQVSDQQTVAKTIQSLRSLFRQDPALADRLLDTVTSDSYPVDQRSRSQALIGLYSGADSYYLDFYGPPQTITTVPYARVMKPHTTDTHSPPEVNLQGKVVFVGYSERLHPEQLDKFYTVFSQANGLNLSGVEITATAFANLLENRHVNPLPIAASLLLLFGWGLLTGVMARLLPVIPAVASGIGLGALYLGAAYTVFTGSATWLPLIVPLLVQTPFALFAAVLWHYREVHRERESIRTAFGLYLPPAVVDQVANDLATGMTDGQLMYGTCLSTDAKQYTALSEGMELEELGKLMNAYYETLFEPVRKYQGIVSDVVGDSMLAIWAAGTPDPGSRRNALLAALEINQTVNRSGSGTVPHHLPTRIGLHTGQILLGSVGAIDHYEYRAVGDIVNTSTRIQGMNSYLGTRVLLTREVLEDIEDLVTREIGTFLLAGKTQPLVLHELIGHRDNGFDPVWQRNQAVFAEGLAAFRNGDFGSAQAAFTRLLDDCNDTVSRYYLNLCRDQSPDADWDGVVRLDAK